MYWGHALFTTPVSKLNRFSRRYSNWTMGNVLSAAELPVAKVNPNYLQEPEGALIRTFGETYAPMGVKL
jgi:hypothetical protein